MEIIILNDGIFTLVEVTKQMLSDTKIYATNINSLKLNGRHSTGGPIEEVTVYRWK